MSARHRIHRSGVALVVMGIVLSTIDVNPAGEIPGAYADEPPAIAVASPQPSAPRYRLTSSFQPSGSIRSSPGPMPRSD